MEKAGGATQRFKMCAQNLTYLIALNTDSLWGPQDSKVAVTDWGRSGVCL